MPRWKPQETEIAISFWNAGLSAEEISTRHLKTRSRAAIIGRLYRLWLKSDGRITRPVERAGGEKQYWSDREMLEALSLRDMGWPVVEIASKFRRSSIDIKHFFNSVDIGEGEE